MNYNLLNILVCNVKIGESTFRFLGNIFNWILIIIPVLLILLTTIDFVKDISSFDGKMKAKDKFIKRLIITAVIYFIFIIVRFLVVLSISEEAGECMDCLLSPHNCKVESVEEEPEEEIIPDEEITPEEEINWNCSSGQGPTVGCRVHFSGIHLADIDHLNESHFSVLFEEDSSSHILGSGSYNNLKPNIPKALNTTFDSIAIDKDTKLIFYSKENFEGNIVLEQEGPYIVYNKYWNENLDVNVFPSWNYLLHNDFSNYGSIFTQEKRGWSSWTMWYELNNGEFDSKGSFKICCKSE